ncbi:MAG: carbohydrate ABC transporter substrate-binding protein [Clostridia bacterium]|nr:carbohydrate ABC transporter substrate-binding protein [Clostridia bacterium]
MRKKVRVLLVIIMITAMFSGCAGEPGPLRICVDLAYIAGDTTSIDLAMYDFEVSLEKNAGVTNFAVEYIPETGAERETALDRIRTEIMSGGGPDVYIIHCAGGSSFLPRGEALFLQPEKAMETGLFLPLDEYIENARYAEWDKFTPSVMNAGRTEEGQMLIPITYSLPAAMYRAADFQHTPTKMTWDEMLSSEQLYDSAARLGDGFGMKDMGGGFGLDFPLDYILGKLADYKNEELAFTEEELLNHVNTMFELQKHTAKTGAYDTLYWSEGSLGILYSDSSRGNRDRLTRNGLVTSDVFSLVPFYSDDGGATAMVQIYAAVNSNTRRPQDAFDVIDYFLATNRMQNSELLDKNFYMVGKDTSMSIHEEMCSEAYPLNRGTEYTSEENFAAMSAVRDQITNVQFAGQLNIELQNMMLECYDAHRFGEDYTGIVHRAYETMDRILGE